MFISKHLHYLQILSLDTSLLMIVYFNHNLLHLLVLGACFNHLPQRLQQFRRSYLLTLILHTQERIHFLSNI